MRLLLVHPGWGRVKCSDCIKWEHDDHGQVILDRDGKTPVERNKPPPGQLATPCYRCPKIPIGKVPCPESAVEPDDRMLEAFMHYMECKATGLFPDDEIVKRNAAFIRMIEEDIERTQLEPLVEAINNFVGIVATALSRLR